METCLKLLSAIDSQNSDSFQELCTVQLAHVRFLQEEYAGLIVQGQYGKDTSRVFKSLQKNTSAFNPAQLEHLRAAVAISAADNNRRTYN